MRGRVAWLVGSIGVAGAAAYRIVRGKKAPHAATEEPDPRAEELRRRLDESRELVSEREEFESAETPVDHVEPSDGVNERRRAVHDQGRSAIEEMQPKEE